MTTHLSHFNSQLSTQTRIELVIFFLMSLFLQTSCGGGGSVPGVTIPPPVATQPNYRAADLATSGVNASIARSGPAISGATSGLSSARNLRGPGKVTSAGGQYAAATAIDAPATTNNKAERAKAPTPFAMPSVNIPKGGGGSGAGGSQGQSSAPALGGDTKTSAATEGSGAAPTQNTGSDVASAGYSSGGGAGASAATAEEGGSLGGGFGGGGGGIKHGGSEVSFARAGSMPDGTVLNINDPEDYFTRVDLGQSIFKVIQTRYRDIDAGWIREETRH